MQLLKPFIISVITIVILAAVLPTVSFIDISTLIIAGLVLSLLQHVVKPVVALLFLPINIITLGLFSVVINAAILWLATFLVPGFEIQAMTVAGIGLNQFLSLVVVSGVIGLIQSFIRIFL
ncbi:MAG: hypothetical protein COU69_03710 [Candidatus Pacebacteria bacterium CG10_big_fil_rev_8_21_14_0_10_56_10]|nr:MAG: hypothetical protein COU69_03710 [Candidatus Pacebacteria bacterium CG10_big_fil_rev_8_21_14_0_10_56_10]